MTILDKSKWNPIERKIWIYALAATPAWILYCVITGIFMFDEKPLGPVPEPLSSVFESQRIIPGDVDSMSQGFQALLNPSPQTRNNSEQNRESQRAQNERIASVNERNRQSIEHNEGYIWRTLSKAFGYPIAWLGALLTLFEVRSRLENEEI